MKRVNWLKVTTLSVSLASLLNANITGQVYLELPLNGQNVNSYGTKDSNEPGVKGVVVKAYDNNNNLIATTTTNSNGEYELNTTSGKYRLEFYPQNGLVDTYKDNIVKFVSDGAVANLGLYDPSDYVNSSNPKMISSIQINGSGKGSSGNYASIVDWDYMATTDDRDFHVDANNSQTGAIWGLAYSRQKNMLYAATVVRRHAGFGENGDIANIYAISNVGGDNPTTQKWINLKDDLGINVGNVLRSSDPNDKAHYLPDDTSKSNYDNDAYLKVGKAGIGDIDLSSDEKTLYVMDLKNKKVLAIDTDTKQKKNSFEIPDPGCSNGDYRPWAISTYHDDLYVGVVCSAETSQNRDDLKAYVLKWNGAGFSSVLSFPLNFERETTCCSASANWNPWTTDLTWHGHSHPEPILADIDFDKNGAMILGFMDRYGYMGGNNNYTTNDSSESTDEGHAGGDILRACPNSNGTWDIENDGSCGGVTTDGSKKDHAGPGGGEFYTGDDAGQDDGGLPWNHYESALGGLVTLKGSGEVMTAVFDPINADAGGVARLSNSNGKSNGNKKELYGTQNEGGPGPHMGKSGGIGDIEVISAPAPVEIGDRVWIDSNQNGIQDADEPAYPNVPVKLECKENGNYVVYGTATTNSDGYYLFGGFDNKNLNNGKTLKAGMECKLSIAQSDVNDKEPTQANVNDDRNDTIDNDAVANGDRNEIEFTTTTANNHNLDFGITPALGCVEGLLYDDENNNSSHQDTEQVGSNIKLIITDKFGTVHEVETNSTGHYQLLDIPAGSATIKVDTTDTDIPEGAVWYNSTFNVTIPESNSACLVQDARFYIPAPRAQDPKDVAICANPTSLTWEGATVSSHSAWHNMASSSDSNAKTFTTAGGSTVKVKMYIENPDNKFNNPQSGTYDGNNTDGTDGAFNDPYLTLYLGDQPDPGDGNWNNSDGKGCAYHGYYLESGQKIKLIVDFNESVVLDNWRIRDVDSGDDRGGIKNWNWQDGIEVEAWDKNGNPVEVETKIGDAGAGLIKDSNGIVHTDPATYNGGDVAHGTGTSPNSTNGHIVLTSNFKPIKKLIITHVAGPNVPCQTRSALALAGFAVCKPLHIKGTVYDDKDGVQGNSGCSTTYSDNDEKRVGGTPINNPDGVQLHACLVDKANGKVIDWMNVRDNGTFDFMTGIKPNSNYQVIVTTQSCSVDAPAPTATLPTDWNYEGEKIDPTTCGEDGSKDGKIDVPVATSNVIRVDFAINKRPTAESYERPKELNPGLTTGNPNSRVSFIKDCDSTHKYITDYEENQPKKIKIESISGCKVYYNGSTTELSAGDLLGDGTNNIDFCSLEIDPDDGEVICRMTYKSIDKAGRESDIAEFRAPFTTLHIAGALFLDMVRDNKVDGNTTSNSCDGSTPIYVNLVKNGEVIASKPLSGGTYLFNEDDGITADTNYTIVISTEQNSTSSTLTPNCMHYDGEHIGLDEGNDGNRDGKIKVQVHQSNVEKVNFAITPSVKIGDLVWVEDDNDGNANTGDVKPVANATVTATCGDEKFSSITDQNGTYHIEVPVNIGECSVSVSTNKPLTPTNGSNDSDTSNDENNKTHNSSGTIVVVKDKDITTLDFGFIDQICLGDRVWFDENVNGIQDSSEKGVRGVKVTLFDEDGNIARDIDGNSIAPMMTDSNGHYEFCKLKASKNYKIKFDIPKGYHVTLKDKGDDNKDSDADKNGIIDVFNPTAPHNNNYDLGIYCDCSDLKAHPNNHKISASALNIFGLASMLIAIFSLIRRED